MSTQAKKVFFFIASTMLSLLFKLTCPVTREGAGKGVPASHPQPASCDQGILRGHTRTPILTATPTDPYHPTHPAYPPIRPSFSCARAVDPTGQGQGRAGQAPPRHFLAIDTSCVGNGSHGP